MAIAQRIERGPLKPNETDEEFAKRNADYREEGRRAREHRAAMRRAHLGHDKR